MRLPPRGLMRNRRALIVADAAGTPGEASGVLTRAGFATVVQSPTLDHALGRVRGERFDLLVIPVQDIEPGHLAQVEQEIRAAPSMSVIGTAPRAEPELILRAMRAGVHEFLVAPPAVVDLAAAVERLTTRGQATKRGGQIIAVYSAKGGLGTTSIAVNTAHAIAAFDPSCQVALADGVFAGGDVRVFLNLRPTYHMGDLVTKLDEVDATMLRSLMTSGPGGSWVLPSPDDPTFEEAFDGATVTAIMEQLRANFDVTVIDCEHQLGERTLAVLDLADRVLLVTQPNVPGLRSTQRTLQLFRRLGYADEKTCVVLNRFEYGDVFTLANVAESLSRPVYWSLPNDYRTSSGSLNKGVSVIQ
jgi:pilus assembly protein CpaE